MLLHVCISLVIIRACVTSCIRLRLNNSIFPSLMKLICCTRLWCHITTQAFRLCFFSSKRWSFRSRFNIVSGCLDVNLVTGDTSQTGISLDVGEVCQSVDGVWFKLHLEDGSKPQNLVHIRWVQKQVGDTCCFNKYKMLWIQGKAKYLVLIFLIKSASVTVDIESPFLTWKQQLTPQGLPLQYGLHREGFNKISGSLCLFYSQDP